MRLNRATGFTKPAAGAVEVKFWAVSVRFFAVGAIIGLKAVIGTGRLWGLTGKWLTVFRGTATCM